MDSRQAQPRLEKLAHQFRQAYAARRFDVALRHARKAGTIAPRLATVRADVAACLIELHRWEEAIAEAQAALQLGSQTFAPLDALAHAHGALGRWDEVRRWGRKALEARAERFNASPPLEHSPAPMPPPPSPATRAQNVIAFALFGGLPKYCETAVLNAQERARIYPDWTCHFYVDDSVPRHVLGRLCAAGSRVFQVDSVERQWPGPMWRFIACDEPGLHRVIFRDADSLIGEREAGAVDEWVAGGMRFHHMRDGASHTELLMAGLWGCTGGALPPMRELVDRFLQAPLASSHFADQHFLRRMVWPYARDSLLQHDSLFGFRDPRPFPEGPRRDDFHVGGAEGGTAVGMQAAFPDGTPVVWTLYARYPRERAICSYPAVSHGGRVKTELPRRFVQALAKGDMLVRIEPAR